MSVECYHHERRTTGTGKNRRMCQGRHLPWLARHPVWFLVRSERQANRARAVLSGQNVYQKVPITFADQQTADAVKMQKEQFQNENRTAT